MQNKAYSIFSTKSISEDNTHFTIKGIASTPNLDSDKDILKSTGATFRSLPFPFLLNHDHKQPVGQVTQAKATDNGIEVEIKIPYVQEEGKLKEQTEYAIHAIKYQVINGLSVGFTAQSDNVSINKDGGYSIDKFEVYELSLTALQANINAFITSFKSLEPTPTTEQQTELQTLSDDTAKENSELETGINIAINEDTNTLATEANNTPKPVSDEDLNTSDIVDKTDLLQAETTKISEADTTKNTKTSVKLTQNKNKNIPNKVKLI